jgi:hypothetical protein
MTDNLGTSDLSSPATNGASCDSAALAAQSNGPTETVAGADEKEAISQALSLLTPMTKNYPQRPSASPLGVDDKELSTAAKRYLVAEINRLVEENRQMKQFKEKYHDADKKLAVLRETIKPVRRNTFLSSACLIAGSAGVAAAPSFLSISQYGWYVFVVVSAMLLVAGLSARVEGPAPK